MVVATAGPAVVVAAVAELLCVCVVVVIAAVVALGADLGVGVSGWELWLVDHTNREDGAPTFLPGKWTGLIPARGAKTPVLIKLSGRLRAAAFFVGHPGLAPQD